MESSKTKTEVATEEKRIFKENDFRIEQMKEEYFDELLTLYTEFFAPREPLVQTLIKILCKIESSYNVFEQDNAVNKALEIAATTVDSSFSGNKLVYRMTEECEGIARELGCQVATTQSTNKITQHIRKKMGFESRLRIEYQDIEVDGVKPLDISAMNGTTGANIFVKYL
ncbi:hypothetical protein Avbf_11166 [Armadillidium vulgare]|nr:hypothetical protein Avbf_11166 [Armadillidium vulgare]